MLPGRSLGVPGGPRGGPGRSWGVPGGSLGGPWGTSWGAYRSLGGPGVSSGVHGGFSELVILSSWEVNLLLVWGNIDIFDFESFLRSSDVLYVMLFFCRFWVMLFANQ